MNEKELRCYTWTLFQLSPIQQGIQASHAITELFLKYGQNTEQGRMLYDWANDHKTMVCLNGGDSAELKAFKSYLEQAECHYPWAFFKESQSFLDGIMTSVSLILPQEVFEAAALYKETPYARRSSIHSYDSMLNEHRFVINDQLVRFSDWEFTLIRKLNNSSLAR